MKPIEPTFGLERDDWGRLILVEAGGARHIGVEPVRAFPWTSPSRGIAICDDEGRELAWIDDLDNLAAPLRQILTQELRSREFVPEILQIVSISSDSAPSDWEVRTDRGATGFTLDSEEQIRKLGKQRVLITDEVGSRYQITNTSALDPTSRRMLERYL